MLTRQVPRVVLCLLLGLIVRTQHAAALPTLSLDPASQVVQPMQFFSLDVNITDVTDLYGFQFELVLTPGVFAQGQGSMTLGSFFPSADTDFTSGTLDESAGTGTFTFATLVGLPQGIDGSGTLTTIHLKTLTQGGVLSLTSVLLTNSMFDEIPLSSLSSFSASVTVSAATGVPEPTTGLLLATGLAGLLARGWRRRQRAA